MYGWLSSAANRLMPVYNHRIGRWEVRCLDTDELLARRRTFAGACEVWNRLLDGEYVLAFPDPYDWAIDGL